MVFSQFYSTLVLAGTKGVPNRYCTGALLVKPENDDMFVFRPTLCSKPKGFGGMCGDHELKIRSFWQENSMFDHGIVLKCVKMTLYQIKLWTISTSLPYFSTKSYAYFKREWQKMTFTMFLTRYALCTSKLSSFRNFARIRLNSSFFKLFSKHSCLHCQNTI